MALIETKDFIVDDNGGIHDRLDEAGLAEARRQFSMMPTAFSVIETFDQCWNCHPQVRPIMKAKFEELGGWDAVHAG